MYKNSESKKLEKTLKEFKRLRDSGEIDKTLEIKILSDDYTELSESEVFQRIEKLSKLDKEFESIYQLLVKGEKKWMKKYRNIGH